jgi:PPM family protein phosphatase
VLRVTGFDDIEYASRTDVGVRRSHNQDAHVLMPATDPEQWRQRGHVFLVADGMGAHAVGELASKMAVDNIPHIYSKHAGEGAVPALRKSFVEANVTIHTRGRQNREFQGMGTTATALILRPEGAWIAHVGDSRVYRIRGGVIEQLSFDHSLVWELARRQQKQPEEMQGIPPNVIVRSLGPEPLVQVDVEGPHPVQPGDTFLLCSDGLSGQVNDRELGAVVSALPPEEACRFLVHLANQQGGPDNITVIIVRAGTVPPEGAADSADPPLIAAARPSLVEKLAPVLRKAWAFVVLGVGVVLASLAGYLAYHQSGWGFSVLILAGLALLGGLVGVVLQNLRETQSHPEPDDPHEATVYRQTPCGIDSPLLQRLAGATRALEQNIQEKGWQVEDRMYREHLERSQAAAQQGRLREAFAEQCRALLILLETAHQYRSRGEFFKPLWDREPPNGRPQG